MNNRWGVGIVGAGNISSAYDSVGDEYILTHAKAVLNNDAFKLLGFYDVDEERARSESEKWGVDYYASLEDLLSCSDIVCIAVPDLYHYEIFERCIRYGNLKAIILEKPIASSLRDAKRMIELGKAKHTLVLVNYSRRYAEEFSKVKEWISSKAGKLISGVCFYGKGVVHNSSHLVNLMDYFFNDIDVRSIENEIFDGYDNDPSREFILKCDGALVHFLVIPAYKLTVFGFDMFFENGRIKYIGSTNSIEYYTVEESEIYKGEVNYRLSNVMHIDHSKTMCNLYNNLYNVLSGKDRICCDLNDGLKTLEICRRISLGELQQ